MGPQSTLHLISKIVLEWSAVGANVGLDASVDDQVVSTLDAASVHDAGVDFAEFGARLMLRSMLELMLPKLTLPKLMLPELMQLELMLNLIMR